MTLAPPELLLPASRQCQPRYATQRTPERPTMGQQAALIAAALGTPLMPWQRQVFDVALEQDPDTGRFVYKNVCVTVSRQSGKTTMMLTLLLLRSLGFSNQRLVYTAQTQSDAKKKFINDWLPLLDGTKFQRYFKTTLSNGQESLRFTNSSLVSLIATTLKSGHGMVLDMAVIDEVFSLKDSRMEQALIPATLTRHDPGAQFWIVSTAGTYDGSPYLWSKVETGRQLVTDGCNDTSAYFEWSADEDADPGVEETWRKCNPAIGRTQTVDGLRAAFQSMDLSEFRRACLNQWVTAPTEPVISLEVWTELLDTESQPHGQVAIGFDVTPDRQHAAIAAASKRADGLWHIEVIDARPGTNWIAPAIAQIWHSKRPAGIWLDRSGPAGSIITELANLNVPLVNDVPTGEHAKACGLFFDACMDRTLRHRDDPTLVAALDGAVKRPVTDSWVWNRKGSGVDISPLVAVTMALFGAKQFSRTPSVWSIRELMEEKQRAAAELPEVDRPTIPTLAPPERRGLRLEMPA